MEKLIELLKETRISMGPFRWMFWDIDEWTILERLPYARKNTILHKGDDLEKALTVLIQDDEE